MRLLLLCTMLLFGSSCAVSLGSVPEQHTAPGSRAKPTPAQLKAGIQRSLNRWRAGAQVPGAVVAVTDGTRVVTLASGLGRVSPKRAMRPTDRLRVASASKTLVAAVVLQLVSQGKLSLDDTVEEWFPTLPQASAITVRMLLNHTSGVPDYSSSAAYEALPDGANHPFPHDGAVAAAASMTRPFAPGAKYEYSNTNYHLLGLIVEDVTGTSLFANIRTRLLRPLKLTGIKLDDGAGPHQATVRGYDEEGTDLIAWGYAPMSAWRTAGWADGAGVMTATELARWGRAVFGTNKVLKPAVLEQMTAGALDPDSQDANGLGVFGDDYGGLQHTGGDLGFESLVVYYPDLKVGVGVIANGIAGTNADDMDAVARPAAVLARRAWGR